MGNRDLTREELEGQVAALRARVAELERAGVERQQMAEALRAAKDRFRLLYERAPLGYQSLDERGCFLEVNQAWLSVLGYSREEVIGRWFGDFLAPDYVEHFRRHFPCFKSKGEIHGIQFEMLRKDGSPIVVEFDGKIGFDEYGEFEQTHCILQDITRRRRAEEALEQSVSLLQATLDSTADGLLVVDRKGRISGLNQRFIELWSIPDALVAAREDGSLLSFVLDQLRDPQAFLARVRELYANPEAEGFDTLEFKDGRIIERYSRPQRVGVEIVGRVWSFRDVTVRRQAAEELVRYRDHLEELVAQRTRELEESRERMRQAERLASVGTLAAGIAHEINNPVGGILMAAQVAHAAIDDRGTVDKALTDIIRDAERCGRIVRAVLKFSRQEPMAKAVRDLNTVVRQATDLTRRYAENSRCVIESRLADGQLEATISETEIEQVVVNLIQNAVQAGASHVVLRTEAALDQVRLIVRDDGNGMTAEQRKHIFDPFYTARQGRGGTGLGLSITHGIIQDHGASIDVQSEAQEGTTVTIAFPLPGSFGADQASPVALGSGADTGLADPVEDHRPPRQEGCEL